MVFKVRAGMEWDVGRAGKICMHGLGKIIRTERSEGAFHTPRHLLCSELNTLLCNL